MSQAAEFYRSWEDNHIFGDYTPASDYAIRELVTGIIRRVEAPSCGHVSEETR